MRHCTQYKRVGTYLLPVVVSMFFSGQLWGQQYCIPPFNGSTYAGIVHVGLNGTPAIDRQSGWGEKYVHVSETTTLSRGFQYSIALTTENSLSDIFGNTNARVWIDWNHDYDFNDPGEQVVKLNNNVLNKSIPTAIVVPEDAVLGATRMRVYVDMVESGGHDTPTPCGYEYSKAGIEHHGEVEDYTITIADAAASVPTNGVRGNTLARFLPTAANTGSELIPIAYEVTGPTMVAIDLYALSGRHLLSVAAPTLRDAGSYQAFVDGTALASGCYLVRLATPASAVTRTVNIVR